jgi:hypothetical protein
MKGIGAPFAIYGCGLLDRPDLEIWCHRAKLTARSPTVGLPADTPMDDEACSAVIKRPREG